MRKLLKGVGLIVLLLAIGVAALFAFAWHRSASGLARTYDIADPALVLPYDADGLARGKHLFETRGCDECHAAGGIGALVMDAGPVIRVVAPNITPARLVARGYDADGVARAIRHGVRADGRPLIFMPSESWSELSDADTAALVAYMQTLPESSHEPGAIEVRPLGRVLYTLGQFPLIPAEHIDHRPRTRAAMVPAASAEFGAYVANVCAGCHGSDFAGGPPKAPDSPPVSDLTPSGLGAWDEADFFRAMREGKRPDGRAIDPFMPWKTFGRMSDTELRALWLYLQSLPPAPRKA